MQAAIALSDPTAKLSGVPEALAVHPRYKELLGKKARIKETVSRLQREFEEKHGRKPETAEEKKPLLPVLQEYHSVKQEMAALEAQLAPKKDAAEPAKK